MEPDCRWIGATHALHQSIPGQFGFVADEVGGETVPPKIRGDGGYAETCRVVRMGDAVVADEQDIDQVPGYYASHP